MALRGTLTHRKIRRLARNLSIDPPLALGLAEALWHVTAEQKIDGAIGEMRNSDIADEMFYSGDPDKLVAAMIDAELVDEHPEHRLVVHDWHIWSDDATDNRLARAGRPYANGYRPRMRSLGKIERDRICQQYGWTSPHVGTRGHDEVGQVAPSHGKPPPEPEPEPEPEPVLKNNNLSLPSATTGERKGSLNGTGNGHHPPGDQGLFPDQEEKDPLDTDDDSPTSEKILAAKDAENAKLTPQKRAMRKKQRAAVRRLFAYYLKGTERDPRLYTLTRDRMDKGLSRLEDCLRKTGGDLVKAEKMMGIAIDALLASDYHAGRNEQRTEYTDWTAHLFKSTDKLEWWLAR